MISFRRLLTLSYLAIILLGIALAAPLAWLSLERSYLNNQRANLLAQAQLIAKGLENSDQSLSVSAYSQQSNALPGFHTHIIEAGDSASPTVPEQPSAETYITLIGEDGPVVMELPSVLAVDQQTVAPLPPLTESVSPQELLSRPEIAAAFSGQPAMAIRMPVEGQRVLYAAAPVVAPNGDIARIVYIATPLPESGWAALTPSARWQMVGLVGLVMLFTGIPGWHFSSRLANALGQIVSAAKQVAGGDLSTELSTRSPVSDLHLLSRSFNEMTDSLRRADQAKMAFVADVSHELRTPLTVIKGTVETLQDGALDDLEAREEFLASIANETERLIALVNGLLTLANADGGALKIQLALFNLAALARTRVMVMEGIATRKGLSLHLDIAGTDSLSAIADNSIMQQDCWVLADAQRVTQVLNNLLDNAIRYSRSGDQVRIVITPGPTQVTCCVVDTGPGIAAGHLPHLFNRFYRVEASRNRRLGGSGLGLAICKEIIEAHGGSISVQSIAGKGTTLAFTLPAPPERS
jgi:signal transduction histidine kinase